MISQTCSVCKLPKLLSEFPEIKQGSSYNKLGLKLASHENRCRSCKAEYARNWRAKAPKNYKGSGILKSIPLEDRLLVSAISARLKEAKIRSLKYAQPEPTVDRDYLYQLFKDQNGICALSGVKLKIEKHAPTCLSLDKIKPELGYIKGNVQWLAWAVNRAKGDMREDMFFDMCQQVLEYRKVQRLSKSSES